MINDKLSFCVIKFHELEKSKKDYLQSQPINDKLSFRYIKFRELDLWRKKYSSLGLFTINRHLHCFEAKKITLVSWFKIPKSQKTFLSETRRGARLLKSLNFTFRIWGCCYKTFYTIKTETTRMGYFKAIDSLKV